MEHKIIIKKINKVKGIIEYLIYLMHGLTIIEAYTEIGDDAMKTKITELSVVHGKNYYLPIQQL